MKHPLACRIVTLGFLCLPAALSGCNAFAPVDALLPGSTGIVSELKTLRPGLFLFSAKVNNRPARVLIDTGTPFSLASRDAVRDFRLPPMGINPFLGSNGSSDACAAGLDFGWLLHSASRVELGGFEFENTPFLILQRFPNELVELGVDVVIGASIMAQLDWEIFDNGETLKLYPAGTLARPDSALELTSVDLSIPFFRVRIGTFVVLGGFDEDGSNVPFILDTGYSGAIAATTFVAGLQGLDDPSLPSASLPIVSWTSVCLSRSVIAPKATLGSQEFNSVQVDLLPSGDTYITSFFGLIGARLLGAYETRCSPTSGWIDFRATPDTATQLAVPSGDFGFITTRRDDGQLMIRVVLPGSSAEAAGLLQGDVIAAVNGTAVNDMSSFDLIPLSPTIGDTLQLTLMRNGATLNVSVVAQSAFSALGP